MSTQLNPYLNFRGTAREVLDFYQSVFGGEVTAMTFREQGGMGLPEEEQDHLMHGQLQGPDGLTLMISDAPMHMEGGDRPSGFSISLSGDDDATLRGWFDGLSQGATVGQPIEVAPWGDAFGMLTDKFGIDWMVNITGTSPA